MKRRSVITITCFIVIKIKIEIWREMAREIWLDKQN